MEKLIQLTTNDKRQIRMKEAKRQGPKVLSKAEKKRIKSKSYNESNKKLTECSTHDDLAHKKVQAKCNVDVNLLVNNNNCYSNFSASTSNFDSDSTKQNSIHAEQSAKTSLVSYREQISDETIIRTIDKVAKCLSESKVIRSEANSVSSVESRRKQNSLNDEYESYQSNIEAIDRKPFNEHYLHVKVTDIDEASRKINGSSQENEDKYPLMLKHMPLYHDQIENDFENALEMENEDSFDTFDEEFGKKIFGSSNDYFVEAYNNPGKELLYTYINTEHLEVYEDPPRGQVQNGTDKSGNEIEYFVHIEDTMNTDSEWTNKKRSTWHKDDYGQGFFEYDKDIQYFVEACNVVGQELRITLVKKRQVIGPDAINLAHLKILRDHLEDYQELPAGSTIQNLDLITHTVPNGDKSVLDYISKISSHCEEEVESPNFSEVTRRIVEDNSGLSSAATIERISVITPEDENNNRQRNKSEMIIEELLETERIYVRNLQNVITNYMDFFHDIMARDTRIEIFGNIREIYNGSRDFYKALKKCNTDHREIAETFLRFKNLLELYPKYLKNKPKSDSHTLGECRQILKDRQNELKDRLGLPSYLLNPIQRLGRYILLLENLQKSIKDDCPTLDEAIQLVKKNMQRGNDYVAIESIVDCPKKINLSTKGTFLGREKFNMIKPKRMETFMFLFQDIVVLTSPDHKNAEKFIYKDSILMSDLSLVTTEGEDLLFQLKNFPECKKGRADLYTYVLEAKDSKSHKHWTDIIQKRLWEQLLEYKNDKTRVSKTFRREKPIDKNAKDELCRKSSEPSKRLKRRSIFYLEEQSNYDTL